MNKIIFLPPARNFLKKLKDKNLKKLFEDAIKNISENPQAGQVKTGDLGRVGKLKRTSIVALFPPELRQIFLKYVRYYFENFPCQTKKFLTMPHILCLPTRPKRDLCIWFQLQ